MDVGQLNNNVCKNIFTDHGECFQFDQFDMNTMIKDENGHYRHPKIAVIAKSGSGKSWIIRDILYHMQHLKRGEIICPTDQMTNFYNQYVPEDNIHYEYDSEIPKLMLEKQRESLLKNRCRRKNGVREKDKSSLLVMDDCMSSKSNWSKDSNIIDIFHSGKSYNVSFVLAMQYSLGISPELRSNFDYIFLLGEDFVSNRKKLYEHYAGMFRTKDLFEQVFMQITDDYGCMVINNRLRSSDIKKKVFWYKAKPREKFVVGSKNYLRYNRRHYDKHHADRIPTIDLNNIGSRRGTRIHVHKLGS